METKEDMKAKRIVEGEAKERAKREEKEAKERAKREAKEAKERAKREEKEAKERAKREEKEAKERVKREAKEANKVQPAETKVEEGKMEEKVAQDAKKTAGVELYDGTIKLAVSSPVDSGQLRELEECLSQTQDLRLELIGSSANEGIEIVIWVSKPIPLIDILNEMAPVEQITKKGNKIQVVLKTVEPV